MLAVFGHLNPDTDAITAALVYARLLTRQGVDATAYRLGDLNFETAFVLKEAGVDAPAVLPELPAGAPVALVDHNECPVHPQPRGTERHAGCGSPQAG